MRVPSRNYTLGGVECHARDVAAPVWQAHVLKHPFGMGVMLQRRLKPEHAKNEGALGPPPRARRPWNAEGWDQTSPPVITPELRESLVAAIKALQVGGATCRLPRLHKEAYGGEISVKAPTCYDCPNDLASLCASTTDVVGTAYRDVVDATLELLADAHGLVVPRVQVAEAILGHACTPTKFEGLAVLSLGIQRSHEAPRWVGRVNRWDGVRIEFCCPVKPRGRLVMTWRTTYRQPLMRGSHVTFLLDFAAMPAAGIRALSLSDSCIVPRLWWQKHGGQKPR